MGDIAQGVAQAFVADDETVCRLAFSADHPISRGTGYPQKHDPETGLIRMEEITWDDLKKNGFSVQICSLYSFAEATDEAARRNAERSAKAGFEVNYRLAGCHFAIVRSINEIVDEAGQSMFYVLDSRTPEAPAHAEIRATDHLVDKSILLKYRESLRDVLGRIRDARDIDKFVA